jgi:DNA-directed RNA polymerase specialized sigma subunit
MTDTVPYIKLTKKAEEKCLDLLVQANVLLKKWAECFGARKSREFRKLLFKGHRDKAAMAEVEQSIPVTLLDEFRQERQFIIAIHVTKYPDLDNRTVEFAMLCGYSGLGRKHAKRWFAQNGEGNGMSLDDYKNEAYLAILDSIYGYTDRTISFSSFAWASLKNRMIACTNKCNLLCPLTNPDLELLARYEDTRKTFNDHVTFDQVVAAMGLDEEQYKALGAIMTKVYAESQIAVDHTGHDDTPNDYTSLRSGIDNDGEDRIIRLQVRQAIDEADLTDFERIVLETSMNPYYGWQSDVARNNINPSTKKPYTRMWVGLALKNAHEKVRQAIQRVA